ncbi:MAG: hypothetical protein IPK76_04840 [Lewinellaceae bacterium]|jgi:lantibiotic modifying enzyme|nr:hypothetical protein [Lewinellaceae bacterium]
MDSWNIIMDAGNQNKAKALLDEIAYTIQAGLAGEQEISLGAGAAGQLLFLCECLNGTFDPEGSIASLLETLARTPDLQGGLSRGLAGIGLALKIIHDRYQIPDEDLLNELYGYVRQFSGRDVQTGNYDYLAGYLGQCFFLLEDDLKPDNYKVLKMAAENLRRVAVPQTNGFGWISPYELQSFYKNEDVFTHPVKDCNLGLSHGSAGIIMMLSSMKKAYPKLEISDLLDGAIEFLSNEESEENKTNNGYYYKGYSGNMGNSFPGRLAWCYCDLGISLMYFNLWETSGNGQYLERANRIAQSCACKSVEEARVVSAGLCHGFAGIAHLFNKIYQKTGDEIYRRTANYWFSALFDALHLDGPTGAHIRVSTPAGDQPGHFPVGNGFMDGLSGIGLCLYSAISAQPPRWDKILLV